MDLSLVIRGLGIGLAIVAPVGPIGVLCIRCTLSGGRARGLAAGLGAATADAVYGAVAGFGITAVSQALVDHQAWLRALGGAFLCYLGAQILLSRPAESPAPVRAGGLAGVYAATLLLTLTNPMTVISFAAVFAGLGEGAGWGGCRSAALLVAGVFLGSALWWLILTSLVGWAGWRLGRPRLRWVNILSGLVIGGFGIAALLTLTRMRAV